MKAARFLVAVALWLAADGAALERAVRAEGNAGADRAAPSAAASEAIDTPAVRARLEGLGLRVPPPEARGPDYLVRHVAGEIEKWSVPIRANGISMD